MADPQKFKKPVRRLKKPVRLKPPALIKKTTAAAGKQTPPDETAEVGLTPDHPHIIPNAVQQKFLEDLRDGKVSHAIQWDIIKHHLDYIHAREDPLMGQRKPRPSQTKYPGQPASKHGPSLMTRKLQELKGKALTDYRKSLFSDDAVIPEEEDDSDDDYPGKEFEKFDEEEK